MTKEEIIKKFQKLGYQSDTAVTLIHQYTTKERSSLLKEQVSNRNSKGWVKGEYVIAYYDGEVVSVDKNLDAWKLLAEKYKNQYLILEVNTGEWKVYNYKGEELGGEEYIEKLFEKRDVIQKIYYGCPGSGKSHYVKDITENVDSNFVFRTTFHPDTDHASFVGCYKPCSNNKSLLNGNNLTEDELLQRFFDSKDEVKYKGDIKARYLYESLINAVDIKKMGENASTIADKLKSKGFDKTAYVTEANCMYKIYNWLKEDGYLIESNITYAFLPQVFTNAYVKAWEDTSKPVYLIIEEINRGNCAQIFGDLFQLLDRKNGVSEYPVKADKDLADYLKKELGAEHEGIANGELKLPSNLIIYATMNTSDQSLFPMDSAFKRRWDWEYVPINYSKDIDSGKFIIEIDDTTKYSWVEFLESVNDKIYDATNSEDKQMGNFFIKKSIKANEFVNKVMFYLWNEVCKEEYGTQRNFFRKEGKTEFKFTELFGDNDNQARILKEFMTSLGVDPIGKKSEEPAAE